MNYTGKHLTKAALKLGYMIKEGGKHILVFDPTTGRLISIFPRGKIKKKGTLAAILKQLGVTEAELKNLI
ncbi:MAG: type II toxin-antitoxin system HicA family toxin [Deltaproteobacteria bacterium]|nr:MAG: type II toxin-antitoxin system HicA family toxin [Deltaproteobacteria bacterium]